MGSVTWTVSALLLAAGDSLAARFGSVSVRGELSGFARASSGHCYFALKDAEGAPALLRCAMFRRAATLVDFEPRDGMQVQLRGRFGVYEPRGELQVVVESLQRLGAGTLYEEFLRLRARLEAQGLFDPARKRPLPAMARRVAVVTSPGAAALHDVLSTLRRRAPHVSVVVVPSLVQGAEAPAQLVAALTAAGRLEGLDAVLLVRGGGSLEDLWAFNDERVVRAVVACAAPVVCGVGHETDITLCDLAADLRAATPTAAAERVAPDRHEALEQLQARRERLRSAVARQMQRSAQRVDAAALRMGPVAATLAAQVGRLRGLEERFRRALVLQRPQRHEALRLAAQRLQAVVRARLDLRQAALQALADRLRALDPQHVLTRGYVWVQGLDGRPLLSATDVAAGDRVRARWADGQADMLVESVGPPTRPL